MKLPMILADNRIGDAAKLLSDYYTELVNGSMVRTGAYFETWAGGGDSPEVENVLTADDVIAASFLSVQFPSRAVIGMLETHRQKISELLEQIPVVLDLGEVSPGTFDKYLGPSSPAWELWDVLRNNGDDKWGVGPTKASKLMARKRPRLIPIWDSVVQKETGLKSPATQWNDWHSLLTADDGQLVARLDAIQEQAQLPHTVSRLRAMDVVLWMEGTNGGRNVPAADEEPVV